MPSELMPGVSTDETTAARPLSGLSRVEMARMMALLDKSGRAGSASSRVPDFGYLVERRRRPWRGYTGSVAIHVCVALLLFAVSWPGMQAIRAVRNVVLIAPQLKPYEPPKPPRTHLRPFVMPKLPPPPAPDKVALAAPPVIAQELPPPAPPLQPKVEVPPPVVQGQFAGAEAARSPEPTKQVVRAGFGDPEGVLPKANSAAALTVAKLGGFDLAGDTKRGTAGRALGATSFGSVDSDGSRRGPGGAVRAGGFGDGAQGTGTVRRAAAVEPTTTAAEILFKPKPAYTDEARNLRIEGQVLLEVTLRADGTIQIQRLIQGLGHGLDEAAAEAARQVRFRPATRHGVPIDVMATLTITFQLT